MKKVQTQEALPDKLRQAINEAIAEGRFKSVNAVARAADIDQSQLSRFMKGERELISTGFLKVCSALGLQLTQENASPTVGGSDTHASQGGPAQGQGIDWQDDAKLNRLESQLEDEDERIVLRGKRQGLSHAEIARSVGPGCTEAEVGFMYRMIRKRLAKLFGTPPSET